MVARLSRSPTRSSEPIAENQKSRPVEEGGGGTFIGEAGRLTTVYRRPAEKKSKKIRKRQLSVLVRNIRRHNR